MELIYIRHGHRLTMLPDNDWEKHPRYVENSRDDPLSNKGMMESFETGVKLTKLININKYEYIYCSPFQRCINTAIQVMKGIMKKTEKKLKLRIEYGLQTLRIKDMTATFENNKINLHYLDISHNNDVAIDKELHFTALVKKYGKYIDETYSSTVSEKKYYNKLGSKKRIRYLIRTIKNITQKDKHAIVVSHGGINFVYPYYYLTKNSFDENRYITFRKETDNEFLTNFVSVFKKKLNKKKWKCVMEPKRIIDISNISMIKKPINFKKIIYKNGILNYINTIDNEQLNEFSEFRIGSITKIFTYVLLLVLHQKKIINIYDNVTNYMSSDNNDLNISILDVINHKAGLKKHPDESRINFVKFKNVSEVFDVIDKEKYIIQENKNKYVYSNIGCLILGALIEKVTNMDYIDVLKKHILIPLKLKHTDIGETNITLYTDDEKKLEGKSFNEIYFASSAGGLYSCVNDLIAFGKNVFSLLTDESKEMFKTFYFFVERELEYKFAHEGGISGGEAKIKIIYDKKFNFKYAWGIELTTIYMYHD